MLAYRALKQTVVLGLCGSAVVPLAAFSCTNRTARVSGLGTQADFHTAIPAVCPIPLGRSRMGSLRFPARPRETVLNLIHAPSAKSPPLAEVHIDIHPIGHRPLATVIGGRILPH